jgi:prepilin-type N-terminal cleavage/methylation domain-containing protein
MQTIKGGFTLVELLVVIAILSILSTLGLANFQSSRIKARDLSRKSDLKPSPKVSKPTSTITTPIRSLTQMEK